VISPRLQLKGEIAGSQSREVIRISVCVKIPPIKTLPGLSRGAGFEGRFPRFGTRFLGHEICAKKRLAAANETIGPWPMRICVINRTTFRSKQGAPIGGQLASEFGHCHNAPAYISSGLDCVLFVSNCLSHLANTVFFNRGMKWEFCLGSCSDSSQGRWPNF
jgi:hypothetical protein